MLAQQGQLLGNLRRPQGFRCPQITLNGPLGFFHEGDNALVRWGVLAATQVSSQPLHEVSFLCGPAYKLSLVGWIAIEPRSELIETTVKDRMPVEEIWKVIRIPPVSGLGPDTSCRPQFNRKRCRRPGLGASEP